MDEKEFDESTLELQDLSVFYGSSQVVREISADFDLGKVYGLVGRIGAGKTSTFKGILGLVDSSGAVKFKGKDVSEVPAYKRIREGLGYVPENREVFEEMTVEENLKAGFNFKPEQMEQIFEIFTRLKERTSEKAKVLSGGERQMLSIARTLMNSPDFILMDEPFEGLAKPIIERLYEVLQTFINERTISIIIAGNNLNILKPIAKKVFLIERGEIVFRSDNMGEVEGYFS